MSIAKSKWPGEAFEVRFDDADDNADDDAVSVIISSRSCGISL